MATRLYGLFFRTRDGKRYRVTSLAFAKASAVRVFQSALLGNLRYNAELRPLNEPPAKPAVFVKEIESNDSDVAAVMAAWNDGQSFRVVYPDGNASINSDDLLDKAQAEKFNLVVVFLGCDDCFRIN